MRGTTTTSGRDSVRFEDSGLQSVDIIRTGREIYVGMEETRKKTRTGEALHASQVMLMS